MDFCRDIPLSSRHSISLSLLLPWLLRQDCCGISLADFVGARCFKFRFDLNQTCVVGKMGGQGRLGKQKYTSQCNTYPRSFTSIHPHVSDDQVYIMLAKEYLCLLFLFEY